MQNLPWPRENLVLAFNAEKDQFPNLICTMQLGYIVSDFKSILNYQKGS